ncbi:MAG: AbrB/MazE/SpoVT family DNA-binding domain-containing protein [Sphingobium sp.]|uniref:AbrB/MazE/SpoVT family DNA-binding domain-containing protein n=1 Tax=Sphingobium sp. TaxID=1912891 RepID=UPI0029B88B4B|nr:AbrB/MazE/SpoVT family DNA-binding domain-containing protein [Sphingobium sp.]MDX3909746.1 AbrB/MazE/SpoVT family DNA-binding domain-containing protein [Sphingobium sp.]
MSQEYRAKVFKSGNSLALRLPKGLGLKEGTEMKVREERGRYIAMPVDEKPKKIDLAGIYGSAPGFKPFAREERQFEDRELDWEGKLLKGA